MPVNAAIMLANFNTQETSGTIQVPAKHVDVVGELGVSFWSVVDTNPLSVSHCPGLMIFSLCSSVRQNQCGVIF